MGQTTGMSGQSRAALHAPVYTDAHDYFYIPQPGSAGYAFLAFCPICSDVIDSFDDDPSNKLECADRMHYGWYLNHIPWQRVTREYAAAQRIGCMCSETRQMALPGFEGVI